jgi:Na+-driven multidrug efflux pump
MTRDAKESLTALATVSSFVGLFCLALMLIPNDMEIPRWVLWIGFGANTALLTVAAVRRWRKPVEKPE